MAELSFDEYKALRASGLTERQLEAMDDETARAELKGFQQGQQAVRGSAESRVPFTTAAPETVYVDRPAPTERLNPFDALSQYPTILPGGQVADPRVRGIAQNALLTYLSVAPLVEAARPFVGPVARGIGRRLGNLAVGGEASRTKMMAEIAANRAARQGGVMAGAPSIPAGATRVPAPAASALPEIPGGFSTPTVAGEVGSAASRVGGQSAGALQPIIGGAEAQAYREGGQAGLDAMREAARAEGRTVVQAHTRPLPKPRVKPKGKVVGKIEPKVGSAESRVAKPAPKKPAPRRSRAANEKAGGQMIPGELEARLRASQNLTPQQQALVKQILDTGSPEEQAQVWQLLRQRGKF